MNKEKMVQYCCSHCGHYPHSAEICKSLDAAGDECDCESYMANRYNPIVEDTPEQKAKWEEEPCDMVFQKENCCKKFDISKE